MNLRYELFLRTSVFSEFSHFKLSVQEVTLLGGLFIVKKYKPSEGELKGVELKNKINCCLYLIEDDKTIGFLNLKFVEGSANYLQNRSLLLFSMRPSWT